MIALEADLFRFKCHFEASQQDVNRSVATLRSDFVSHCDRLEAVLHTAIDKIERRPVTLLPDVTRQEVSMVYFLIRIEDLLRPDEHICVFLTTTRVLI